VCSIHESAFREVSAEVRFLRETVNVQSNIRFKLLCGWNWCIEYTAKVPQDEPGTTSKLVAASEGRSNSIWDWKEPVQVVGKSPYPSTSTRTAAYQKRNVSAREPIPWQSQLWVNKCLTTLTILHNITQPYNPCEQQMSSTSHKLRAICIHLPQ
jgi:hypothetical protein